MTELLKQAISKIKTLPSDQQEAISSIILEEIEEDKRWDQSFTPSPDLLVKIAAEAMTEYRQGKTQELDPETL
jgi:hypothetical protein